MVYLEFDMKWLSWQKMLSLSVILHYADSALSKNGNILDLLD